MSAGAWRTWGRLCREAGAAAVRPKIRAAYAAGIPPGIRAVRWAETYLARETAERHADADAGRKDAAEQADRLREAMAKLGGAAV